VLPLSNVSATVERVSLRLKPAIAATVFLAGMHLAWATGAEAAPARDAPVFSAPLNGRVAVLVPAHYPLNQSGRKVDVRVDVYLPGGKRATVKTKDRPHAGSIRRADQRKRFWFVHAVPLNRTLSRKLMKGDHGIEISASSETQPLVGDIPTVHLIGDTPGRPIRRAPARMCSSTPMLLVGSKTSAVTKTPTPWCGARARWSVRNQPDTGSAAIETTGLTYIQDDGALGANEIALVGRSQGRIIANRTIQLRISNTAADSISVRAMGDSVTAGFGYFGKTGRPMPFTSLFDCKPAAVTFNDACSSNSFNRNSSVGTTPDFLPDYGLSRNISWAAQWANQYGVTDYKNYAVSGSAPSDWLPGGQFDSNRQQIEQDNPDYIVMTMGANPILSNVLFGIDDMGCALESDLFGDFQACVEAAFATVNLSQNLNALYTQLVNNTTSKILLMQYHLSIPAADIAYTASQIAMMDQLMNETIAGEAAAVAPGRFNVIAPPHFNVGIDITPLYPARFSCSWFDWKVDGPSVQADPSQDFIEALHPLSFCSGPANGPPWIISGDSGIHPSAAGYAQMEARIPAPQ